MRDEKRPALQGLQLGQTQVSDVGIGRFAGHLKTLRTLGLERTQWGPRGSCRWPNCLSCAGWTLWEPEFPTRLPGRFTKPETGKRNHRQRVLWLHELQPEVHAVGFRQRQQSVFELC